MISETKETEKSRIIHNETLTKLQGFALPNLIERQERGYMSSPLTNPTERNGTHRALVLVVHRRTNRTAPSIGESLRIREWSPDPELSWRVRVDTDTAYCFGWSHGTSPTLSESDEEELFPRVF